MYGKSLIVTSHVWACKVCCLFYFELQGQKNKKYFQNFIQIVRSLESNNSNATTNDLNQTKTYQWTLCISEVRIGIVLQKIQLFITWLAGIWTDFYYKELIGIGGKPGFLKLILCGLSVCMCVCVHLCVCVCVCVCVRPWDY